MQYAIEEIRNNSRYRVAILRSANPNMFCAGADLKVINI
jgi:enoyl-CoA hydratase/carnithine racemase